MKKLLKSVLVVMVVLFIAGCGKKQPDFDSIKAEFDKNPTPKALSYLMKHYDAKKDEDSKIEVLKTYLKSKPEDKYAKEDIGKAYAKKAEAKTGDEKMELLIKAAEFGYKNDLILKELSKLVSAKLIQLEKENNEEALIAFMETAKKLPVDNDIKKNINAKFDIMKNKKEFDLFYKPFKENFDKNAEEFVKKIFNSQNITYDLTLGDFTIQGSSKVTKDVETAKVNAVAVISDNFTILRYALEKGEKPKEGEEIAVVPVPSEALACNEGTLSEDKKTITITCKINILDLGKAFFSVREVKEENKDSKKEEIKKEEQKKEEGK